MEDQLGELSFEELVDYVFGSLSESEYERVQAIVLEEPYYKALVQNMMDFCDSEKIYNRDAFKIALRKKKERIFEPMDAQELEELVQARNAKDRLRNIEKDKPKKSTKWWWLPLLCLISFTLWYVLKPRPKLKNGIETKTIDSLINSIDPSDDMLISTPPDTPILQQDVQEEPVKIPQANKDTDPPEKEEKLIASIVYDNAFYSFDVPTADVDMVLKTTDLKPSYEAGDYPYVIATIEAELPGYVDSDKAQAQLMLAKSYLHTKRYTDAEKRLELMQPQDESVRIQDDIKWLLARVYLLTDRKQKGIELLQSFGRSKFRKAADELLLKLDE